MDNRLAQLIKEWEPLQHTKIVGKKSMYNYSDGNICQCDGYTVTVNMVLKKDIIARDLKYLTENNQDPKYREMLDNLENDIREYGDLIVLNTLKS